MISPQKFHEVMASGSLASSAGLCHGASRSALWLPLDLVLEDFLDGSQVNATSAVEIITGKDNFILVVGILMYEKVDNILLNHMLNEKS